MKRLFLFLLVAVMLTSTISCTVTDDSDIRGNNTGAINLDNMTVNGEGISVSDNIINITSGGDFEVTGTLDDGMIYVTSEEEVNLRLSGASITNTKGPAIFFDSAEKAFITITEGTENYLTDGKAYTEEDADAVLFSNDDLEINGDGTLNITGNYGDGIKTNNTLSVLGGAITVKTETGKGMKAEHGVVIDDGDINITSLADEGIESKGPLTINGGNINITAAEDGLNTGSSDTTTTVPDMPNRKPENVPTMPENAGEGRKPQFDRQDGMERPPHMNGQGMRQNMHPPMENGQRQAPPEGFERGGFGMIDEETAKEHALTINGGTIYINANGDGIDSNGNLTITGGVITVDGPTSNDNGPLDSDGTMSITGGTVILSSSAGMVQLPRGADNQNIIPVMFSNKQEAGTKVTVKESDTGEEVVSHTPIKEFQIFVFSSEKITEGKEYTVYVNGEEYQKVTANTRATYMGKKK